MMTVVEEKLQDRFGGYGWGQDACFCSQKGQVGGSITDHGECVSCSVLSDSASPWTLACQDPLAMGFSRQEYWSGLSFPSPGESS